MLSKTFLHLPAWLVYGRAQGGRSYYGRRPRPWLHRCCRGNKAPLLSPFMPRVALGLEVGGILREEVSVILFEVNVLLFFVYCLLNLTRFACSGRHHSG